MYRDATEELVGHEVILSTNDKKYVFTAVKPGPLYKMAQIEDGDTAYWVPLALLKIKPLFLLEGKPVYAEDVVWYTSSGNSCRATVTHLDPHRRDSPIYVRCDRNSHGFGNGFCSPSALSWAPKGEVGETQPTNTALYAVVTHSVPSGKKFFASECFDKIEKAKALKKPSNFVGIYKMEKIE